VFLGHVMGLGIPRSWAEALGLTDSVYHFLAVSVGAVAGFATLVGLAILVYRRRTVGPVFSATTRMDKVMYVVLGTVIVLGLANTITANVVGEYAYREGVSVWFRGIFSLNPQPELMAQAPVGFQLHGIAAFLLFALWPFTRLVHAFSAPIGYLWRPYVVYRSKDDRLGTRAQRPGWGRVRREEPTDDVGSS
jgi:nitrate reductase gamma subunit